MKKVRLLLLALTAWLGVSPLWAEVVSSYKVDFDTPISTSATDFVVAGNWGHLVDRDAYYDNHMSYSYYATSGVNGSGALLCNQQKDYDYGATSSGVDTYDLHVTPLVKGTITLAVKQYNSSGSIKFYKVTGSAASWTRGEEVSYTIAGGGNLSSVDYTTVTLSVDDYTHIGIRGNYVYIDDFSATSADIIPESKLTIASVEPSNTTGVIYWNQQVNGKVLVDFIVTVKNSGDITLNKGDENYSVSLFNNSKSTIYGIVPVPQTLAAGETSAPFHVMAEVETSEWPYSSATIPIYLRENITSSVVQRANSGYKTYESKFIFRNAGTTTSSSLSTAENWGAVSESTTKEFEIYNGGAAPIILKSITLPTGFTSSNIPTIPAEGLEMAADEILPLNITQDATQRGMHAGALTIVYDHINTTGTTEKTYTLDFSANVVGANTWVADFNSTSSTIPFPAGSVAEGGVRTDYTFISSGNYDGCLYSYNNDSYAEANNKFITPKLHAKAGDVLTFDVSRYSNNSAAKYNLKVYVSTDRKTWGEPVYTVTADQLTSTYQNVSIPFDTEGDYYVGFAIFYVRLDNIIGLEKVDVAHDLYIYSTEWPETSIKSGVEQSKPSLDIIPLTDETADNYTVKFIYGDKVVEGTPVALTATSTTRKSFSFKWTPEVEQTTAYTGAKVVFEFTDGTKFETDAFDFTVTKEPVFHFLNNKYTSRWYEPSDYTTPINFGKTTTEDTKTFYIFNWGSAPLTVKNVTMPEGFTASATTMTIPAFDGTQDGLETCQQTLDFTFTATEIGTYSGDIVITYVGADGEDATFTTSVIGTRLDPTLFYATFDDGNNNSVWPAGSVYKGIRTDNTGTYNEANYAITGAGTFVTPKLHAQAGDKILFDAKLYNSNASWADATVTVYAAATREEALNDDEETATRVELGSVSGLDEENPILPDYKTFEIIVPTAGDYYLAFELAGSPRVDEIYGLTVVDVAHDWILGTTSVPETAMQNVNSTAKIALTNLGLHTETAYTIVAYVDGKATETEGTPDIPVVNQLTAVSATIEAPFKSPKVGTFPVYFEIKADDYVVATEPVDVEFTEEVASADGVQVGTPTNTGRDFGFVDWYNTDSDGGTRYTDILYTAAKIEAAGLKSGDKISSITFKGINTEKGAFTKACVTSWVATSTGEIAFGQPDKEAMIEVVVYDPNDATFVFPDNIESVITLPEPIVWDGTSDIRVYTEAVGQGSGNWQTVNYAYDNDIEMSYNGTKKAGPVAYFQLVIEPASISGTVTDGENAIEGATVTLVSNDGDDIQYTGTTDAEGAYDINVVQSNRTYDVTVTAEGYKAQTATADFSETATPTLDFVLAKDEFVNLDFEASTPTTIGVRTTQGDANSKGGIAHMQEVEGWTIASTNGDNRAAAVYAYGSDVFLGGEGYLAPAVSPTGKESNALGLVSVWSSTSQYTQEAALAAGKYVITVPVYNSVGGTTAISKNLIGMSVDGTNHYATTTQYPVNTWKYETISFDVETATRGTLSVGYTPVNTGSANMPHLFIDKVDVQVFESDEARDAYLATIPALEAKATLNVAIANANAKAENTDLFGDGLLQYDADAFNAAIADAQAVLDNAESTLEEIQAALASLNLENYLNKPEAGKLYTIQLKDTDLYMALDGGTKLSDAVVGLSFEAMDNGNYAITNGEGEYVAYTGTGDNTWSMGSSATPYAWKVTLIGDGYYTIAKATNTNHLIGVDDTEAGKNCYANKSQSDKSLWKIYETPEIIPEYTITVAATENGMVVADKQTAAAGDVVTLTITPDDDYELDALTVTTGEGDDATEVELTADNTFIMPAGNVTITATFVAVSHTITIVTSEHGTVEADKQTATAGEVVALTITPDEGYELKTLTVTTGEGDEATEVELTADNTFVMPAGDVTIMAIFVQSTPVGINGLTIDTNATDVYDLQGRKVQNIVKGQVYIVNGKKVWVK